MATQADTQATHATDPTTGVYALGDLHEFAVAEGFPDIRGWDVYGADRQRVGTVDDILIDLAALAVRYLDVRLDGETSAGHVLLPLGLTTTDGGQHVVLVDLPAARVAGLPAYTRGGPLARGYEDALLVAVTAGGGAGEGVRTVVQNDEQYYARPEFATTRFYRGFARGPGAGAGVGTDVTAGATPGARADTPAGPPADAALPGDELRFVAMGEEAVVTTRRVVKEILVIKRRRVVEQQVVEYDLRTERVDVEQPAGLGAGTGAV